MSKMLGNKYRVVLVLALAAGLLTSGVAAAKEGDRAAVVDGVVIPMAKLNAAIRFYKMAAASSGRGVTPGEESKKKEEMLERLIVDQLIFAEANRRKIKVSRSEIDKAIAEFKQRYRIKTDSEFQNLLKRVGKTTKDLRDDTVKQLMRYKLLSRVVAPKAKVSDAEVRKFYNDNKQKLFISPKKVRISQIFMVLPRSGGRNAKMKVKAEMENIRKQIVRGKSFAQMAKRHSQDPSAKEGGNLGYFTSDELSRDLSGVVFSMKKGQLSRVLETSRGFHLIRVTDVEKSKVVPLKDVKVQIAGFLEKQKWAAAMRHFLKGLTAKAKIKRYI